jgi:peptidoglycan/xylan/chitin deacetylase (PgdA/CDA1 family)
MLAVVRYLRATPLILTIAALTALLPNVGHAEPPRGRQVVRDALGAVIRGDQSAKKLSLVFTGDKFGESTGPILDALRDRQIKAAFFVTGNFARDKNLQPLLKRALNENHYVGPHSDSHPLYCDWKVRSETLVTRKAFTRDLNKNIAALKAVGALKDQQPILFIPPYEWYNRDIVRWSEDLGVTLINFTPGSGSNRDYAPEGDAKFVSSRKIYDDILAYERKDSHGLNGFVLLLHLGSGRKDPFHTMLGPLCDELKKRGYKLVRVDELLVNEESST